MDQDVLCMYVCVCACVRMSAIDGRWFGGVATQSSMQIRQHKKKAAQSCVLEMALIECAVLLDPPTWGTDPVALASASPRAYHGSIN